MHFQYRHLETGIAGPSVAVEIGPVLPGAKPVKATWMLDTTGFLAGAYEICMTADGPDLVFEPDEMNNTFCVPSLVLISQPDLRAEPELKIEPPLPVTAGRTVTITGKISNIGGLRADRSLVHFQYRHLETGITGPPEAVEIGPVLPGAKPVKATWMLDSTGFLAGAYEICMTADGPDLISELDETNNGTCISYLVLISKPDLAVQLAFDPDPPIVEPGEEVTTIATVTNQGGSRAGKSKLRFTAHPIDGGEPLEYETDVSGLDPDQSIPIEWKLDTTEMGGTYQVCAEVDPENFIDELDEENNSYCTPPPFIVIGPLAGRADLVPTNLKIKPWPTLQLTALTSVTIANRGEESAGPFDVYFFYEYKRSPRLGPHPVLFATERVMGLEVGEKRSLQETLITIGLRSGDYLITVVVDPQAQVAELNEVNNQIEKTMTIP